PVGRDYAGRDHTTPDRVLQLIDLAAEVAPKVTLIFGHLGGGLPLYAHMPDVRRRIERALVWFDTWFAFTAAMYPLCPPTNLQCTPCEVTTPHHPTVLGLRERRHGVAIRDP
ncbi:MAG: hypothetical protein EBU40_13660, partial [Proteobacteria bacterium]|nr:hypothetical protein [Pseudomonadota bacterium]